MLIIEPELFDIRAFTCPLSLSNLHGFHFQKAVECVHHRRVEFP